MRDTLTRWQYAVRGIGVKCGTAAFKRCVSLMACALPLWASAQGVREAWVARYSGLEDDNEFAAALAVDSQGNVCVTGHSWNGTDYDYATIRYDTNGNQQWVARYNGGWNTDDYARAIAVDPQGNIYVTGESPGFTTRIDYVTIKYDANGNRLWVARYNGPGNGDDYARAIAVDAQGNVYVTGRFWNGTDYDYATVKYDTNGNLLWVSRYNGSGRGEDDARALVVDSQANVYVTGNSWGGTGTYDDYATVKYDPNGNEVWVARYDASSFDHAKALAVDDWGNVYVTGLSHSPRTSEDYLTVKYDANGNLLWVRRYDGPFSSSDVARALAVDGQGHVYVTGRSMDRLTSFDYATVKYDTNGNLLWAVRYDGPRSSWDEAIALTVDSQGRVYVTGRSVGSGTSDDYATVKYDANGNLLWAARYGGNGYDAPVGLALDSQGNVYVAGSSYSPDTYYDYATVKYDANGNQLWTAHYDRPGLSYDAAVALALDRLGNLYVTGVSYGAGTGQDFVTIKYGANGSELWLRRYNRQTSSSDTAVAIATDSQGNVYVAGNSSTLETNLDYTIVKYDADGNLLWVNHYNGSGNGIDEVAALTVDSQGNVYVTGLSWGGSTNSHDYATVKYDRDGNELWVARYNGPSNLFDRAIALAVDGQGNVYVTGSSEGSGSGFDYATVKYDAEGNLLWVARYNGQGNQNDYARSIALDGQGNVYVTGSAWNGSDYDYVTIKYSPDGVLLWAARYDGLGNGNDHPTRLVVDSEGNVYVTGNSRGLGSEQDYAILKYDTNGELLWVAHYNGLGNRSDYAAALALDSQGNVYVTGLSLGAGTQYDYTTVKYDTSGNLLWVARYNGTGNGDDIPTAVVVDGRGNVYVTGRSWNGTDFDYLTVKYVQVSPGDVNGDGCVNDADLLAVLSAFGQRGSGLAEDLNNDGVVDDADLLEVLFNFGSGC
jgi:uncharacterized delta-60 repeat protein